MFPTRKPGRLVGRNVVTEFIAAGEAGSKGTALTQIEDGRTMGSTDPELPRPGSRRRAICNFARTILDPYVQNRQIVDAGEDRGEANARDDIETPNTAAGPSGSSEGTAPFRSADGFRSTPIGL